MFAPSRSLPVGSLLLPFNFGLFSTAHHGALNEHFPQFIVADIGANRPARSTCSLYEPRIALFPAEFR